MTDKSLATTCREQCERELAMLYYIEAHLTPEECNEKNGKAS